MYTFDSRVRYSETDENSFLTIAGIIDYLQDCSTFQSEDLGIGVKYLKDSRTAWLVNFWQIDILRRPVLSERIRIGTSPYKLTGFMGFRNFMIETIEGERLVIANSVWSYLDLSQMKPLRVPPSMVEKYGLFPEFDMEYLPRKIAVPEEGLMKAPAVRVERQHLDSNGHVNNACYVNFAASALTEMIYDKDEGKTISEGRSAADLKRFCIEYRKQAFLGDEMIPCVAMHDDGRAVVSLDGADGKAFAAAEFFFK